MSTPDIKEQVDDFKHTFDQIVNEINKVIVGHEKVILNVLKTLFSGGNVLLEGVPGLGKTMLVRVLSECLDLDFKRIQFTPDLMPADIIGTTIILESDTGNRYFDFQKGPIFSNIILADEINRATPKTQSALLEAMQEHRVTVSGDQKVLQEPFFVLATQNPIEMEGTYPLPEAQLDRFMMKVNVQFPTIEELDEIIIRTTSGKDIAIDKVASTDKIIEMQTLVPQVPLAPKIRNYILRIVMATHPEKEYATDMTKQYIQYGSSPRGAQAIVLASKVSALLDDRFNVSIEDVKQNVIPALMHRIILNFEGEAEGIDPTQILHDIIKGVDNE